MKNIDNSEEKLVLYCDDRNTASPEELAKYPWTEEDEQKLSKLIENVFKKFGLTDEPMSEKPTAACNIAKYILQKQGDMSTWKLQKLCYYAQAWHYTWTEKRLIAEDFQAWCNGPVCPELYNLHKGKYFAKVSDFAFADIDQLSNDAKDSIDVMLEHYGSFDPDKLVKLTHSEDPWRKARGNLPEDAKSNKVITLESMGEYYRKHLI